MSMVKILACVCILLFKRGFIKFKLSDGQMPVNSTISLLAPSLASWSAMLLKRTLESDGIKKNFTREPELSIDYM